MIPMKRIATLTILVLLNAPIYAAGPQDTVTSFHAALAAGDKIKANELLSPEVTIFESGFVERSRAEYASHHLTEDIAFAKASKSKVLKHSEKIDNNLAVIWEESETTGNFEGKDVHLFGTETALLEKKGERWMITHIHWSSRKAK